MKTFKCSKLITNVECEDLVAVCSNEMHTGKESCSPMNVEL